jgi:hypothetical protein
MSYFCENNVGMTSAQFLMNKIMDKEMRVSPNYACMTLATCVKAMEEITPVSACLDRIWMTVTCIKHLTVCK